MIFALDAKKLIVRTAFFALKFKKTIPAEHFLFGTQLGV
jgi:hypothetical protein